MPVAFAALTIGGMLLYAGLKGLSILEVLSGATGNPLDPRGGTMQTGAGQHAAAGATGGGFKVTQSGKVIQGPREGTHRLGNWQSDNAIDIDVPRGTPVFATEDAEVSKVTLRPDGGGRFAGSAVTLNGRSNNFFYTHLSAVTVKRGDRVNGGQQIGSSGTANGVPHLHFAVQRGNPRAYA